MNVRVAISHLDKISGTPNEFDAASLTTIQHLTLETLDVCGFEDLVKDKSVLIKPNLVRPNPDYPSATTTDPRVIIALMRLCRDAGARSIGVGDKPGIGLSCRACEKLLNLDKYFKEVDAHFVYFDESEEQWEANPEGQLEPQLPIPQVIHDYEVFLNVPKLKLHMHTGISLGIKNLFGLVPEHFRLKHHREDLHRFLVDYLYRVNPDLTLIDGLWALEGQAPICGTPVKDFNTLVASRNVVAADTVGAYLMGVNPQSISMIRIAQAEGFGPSDLNEIDIHGIDPKIIRRHFTRPILSSQDAYPGIDVQVRGGCVGCMSSLRHALDRLHLAGKLKEDHQTILLGMRHSIEEDLKIANDDPIFCYGNCCIETFTEQFLHQPKATWLEGCPPHFMEFYRQYCKVNGIDPD
ncbi:DUF362 domain-containing protein [bacterium]|nr:DUF362 domain-containing protein [bacterium]